MLALYDFVSMLQWAKKYQMLLRCAAWPDVMSQILNQFFLFLLSLSQRIQMVFELSESVNILEEVLKLLTQYRELFSFEQCKHCMFTGGSHCLKPV